MPKWQNCLVLFGKLYFSKAIIIKKMFFKCQWFGPAIAGALLPVPAQGPALGHGV